MFSHFSLRQRLFSIVLLSSLLLVTIIINNFQSKTDAKACLINKTDPSCSKGAYYVCQMLTLYSCSAYKNIEKNQTQNKAYK